MKKTILLLIFAGCIFAAFAQKTGDFENHEDVGNPKNPGSVVYNTFTQEYIMRGSGINMWAAADQFHFLWKKIKGDFIISATVRFIGKGTDAHRKIGIIARDKLTTDSRYADACVHGDGLTALQYRQADAAQTEQVTLTSNNPVHIEL